jgi:hypothetical protein
MASTLCRADCRGFDGPSDNLFGKELGPNDCRI